MSAIVTNLPAKPAEIDYQLLREPLILIEELIKRTTKVLSVQVVELSQIGFCGDGAFPD